jgi:hypothetical protein
MLGREKKITAWKIEKVMGGGWNWLRIVCSGGIWH